MGDHLITIDRERCIGSGNCGFWAPATFDLGDDGVAFVITGANGSDGDPDEKILNAARGCPTRAITVSRDGVVLAPEQGM